MRFICLSGIQQMYLPFEWLCWIINKVGSPQLHPVALPWGDCWLSSLFEHCFPTETSLQHTLHSHVFSKLICFWQKWRSEKKTSLLLMQNMKSNYVWGIRSMNQKLLRKHISSFRKIGSWILNDRGNSQTHRENSNLISLLLLFQNKESRLNCIDYFILYWKPNVTFN